MKACCAKLSMMWRKLIKIIRIIHVREPIQHARIRRWLKLKTGNIHIAQPFKQKKTAFLYTLDTPKQHIYFTYSIIATKLAKYENDTKGIRECQRAKRKKENNIKAKIRPCSLKKENEISWLEERNRNLAPWFRIHPGRGNNYLSG